MFRVDTVDRLREIYEYKLKPTRDLLFKGEFGFLAGTIVETLTGRNPYFSYRELRGKDRIVTRRIRSHDMRIDLYDRGISRHLFIRGIHEAEATQAYTDALVRLRNETDGEITVLEIGANLGYYVLEEARILGDRGRIIAFEPDPDNRSLLETNVEENGYSDVVEILSQAVDETSGKRVFCRSTHSNWNRLEREGETGDTDQFTERFEVETTSVDQYLARRGLRPSNVNALRMDLEGHEISVIRGMRRILNANGPLVLFIEFHPDFVARSDYEQAIAELAKYDFEIHFVNQRWKVLNIDSYDELQTVRGTHVRLIASK